MSTFTGPRWEGFFDPEPEHSMRMPDAIKIARWRFNRDSWRGYRGNGWRPDRTGWRKVIRNVKMLCEKRGLTMKDFPS